MLMINRNLYNSRNICNFIDASMSYLMKKDPSLRSTKEYWLFYYIKDDFLANFSSLYNADIDQDFLGFPFIRRNTRHAIESFLDLYNLCMDQDYIEVLKFCAKEQKSAGKYKQYIYSGHNSHTGQFTIQSKCNIANEMYGANFQELVNIAVESNSYVHPNVYMNTIPMEDRLKKQQILKELLHTNLNLFNQAYILMLKRFNQGEQPCLSCCIYPNCIQCYNNMYNEFYFCIEKQLLIEVTPTPINFSM